MQSQGKLLTCSLTLSPRSQQRVKSDPFVTSFSTSMGLRTRAGQQARRHPLSPRQLKKSLSQLGHKIYSMWFMTSEPVPRARQGEHVLWMSNWQYLMNRWVTVWSLAAADPEHIIVLGGKPQGTSEHIAGPVLRTIRTLLSREDKVLLAWNLGSHASNLFLCYPPSWMATTYWKRHQEQLPSCVFISFPQGSVGQHHQRKHTAGYVGLALEWTHMQKVEHRDQKELFIAEPTEEKMHSSFARQTDRHTDRLSLVMTSWQSCPVVYHSSSWQQIV